MDALITKLPIAIGSDHAGYEYKEAIKNWFTQQQIAFTDKGTHSLQSVDYPDYAHAVCHDIEQQHSELGILLCGSANGVCITANKHAQIRAGLAWDNDVAKLIRLHNNANIICIPARFVALPLAIDMITHFLNTPFEGGRHAERVKKISCF